MSKWFRVYDDLVDDPKVQRLQPELFRVLVNIWCLASKNNGVLPPIEEIAFKLRVKKDKAYAYLAGLEYAGLIEEDETGLHPHNWNGRQYKSDVSNERVKRHRERQRNVTETVTVTPPDTETDTEEKETLTGFQKEAAVLPPKPLRGTRLPDDFEPDESCHKLAEKLLFSTPSSQQVFDNFRDYWRSVPGAKGCKLDWQATFRVWLRNQKGPINGQITGHKPGSRADEWAKFDVVVSEAKRRENGGNETAGEEDSGVLPRLRQGSG